MTGWNLPPGVNVNDLPGNRPEDEADEVFLDKLGEKCPDVPEEMWGEPWFFDAILAARDLAYEFGYTEGQRDEAFAHEVKTEVEAGPVPQVIVTKDGPEAINTTFGTDPEAT